MTKPWKLKKNSSNILLVLITLILIKAKCANSEIDNRLEEEIDRDRDISKGNSSEETRLIVGNEKIGRYYFGSSGEPGNGSFELKNLNRCLDNFQLVVCLKMLLLTRINEAIEVLERPEMIKTDFNFLNGLISFNVNKDSVESDQPEVDRDHFRCGSDLEVDRFGRGEEIGLNGEISRQVLKLFRNRSLRINLLPDYKIDLVPMPGRRQQDFLCFGYKLYRGQPEMKEKEGEGKEKEKKGERKSALWEGRKKGGKGGIPMLFMLPQMLMLGFLPFTLAGIKSMIMNSLLLNTMALNGAIFMTIRNLVFGPRKGSNVKYVNYGYSKDRQTQPQRPVLIIHSPAAFVKRPSYHHHHHHHKSHHPSHSPESLEFDFQDRSREVEEEKEKDSHGINYSRESGEDKFYGGRRKTERDYRHTWQNDRSSQSFQREQEGRTRKEMNRNVENP